MITEISYKKSSDDAFSRFLATPTIAILMAQVKTEDKEVLPALLRQAFEAGQTHSIVELTLAVIKGPNR